MQSTLPEWLKNNDLERFRPIFEENEVDLETLRMLTDDDLKEIGLPFGPRKRILSLLRDEKALEKPNASTFFVGAPVGERRQLTVLFCDMVGFTALSQSSTRKRYRSSFAPMKKPAPIASFDMKDTSSLVSATGSSPFLVFRWRMKGEAARAIRAGLDILEAMASLQLPISVRLQVRIGIATGIVVVSRGERNAVGDTMNLASRLQTIAEPGR